MKQFSQVGAKTRPDRNAARFTAKGHALTKDPLSAPKNLKGKLVVNNSYPSTEPRQDPNAALRSNKGHDYMFLVALHVRPLAFSILSLSSTLDLMASRSSSVLCAR